MLRRSLTGEYPCSVLHGLQRCSGRIGCARSAAANDHPRLAAQAAFVLAEFEAVGTGKFAHRVVGMVQDAEPEGIRQAGIADRLGREAHHEFLDFLKYRHWR